MKYQRYSERCYIKIAIKESLKCDANPSFSVLPQDVFWSVVLLLQVSLRHNLYLKVATLITTSLIALWWMTCLPVTWHVTCWGRLSSTRRDWQTWSPLVKMNYLSIIWLPIFTGTVEVSLENAKLSWRLNAAKSCWAISNVGLQL